MTDAPFVLDRFQTEAIAAIDAGRNVLVAAPTGAGKTVVAEHAADRAIQTRRRAFYTTPIKALSNQKFGDLVERHGRASVGLLTGDNAINPSAPIVVMTTEVLRNMIYAESSALDDLAWVILDEVHYLQDPYRGPVWEEVIVHTPPSVRFVCLSATVSNAHELSGWIAAARGPTDTVVETERPVELTNHFLVFDKRSRELVQVETLVDGRANPDGSKFDAPTPDGPKNERYRQQGKHRWGSPRRPEVVAHLAAANLLPAIVFVFSRKGCEDGARSVLEGGIRLTDAGERAQIRSIVEQHVRHLSEADLAVLDYDRWLGGLEAGVGAHHAGMVPPFKEAVEACFVLGLVKVVFATETLALGINMPARSVVIESMSKFTGEHHEDLTPSQYTQLTGRAGRRGLDPVGHALVLWSPWHGFDRVAALASSREFILRSAFQPTYNMVVNLVRRYDRSRAQELLARSFAQYQADQSLGRLANRRSNRQRRLAGLDEAASCDRGDVEEYRALRASERRDARELRRALAELAEDSLAELSPGAVLVLGGTRLGVLSVSQRNAGVKVRVVDEGGRVSILDPDDLDGPVAVAGRMDLPRPFNPNDGRFQRAAARDLREVRIDASAGSSRRTKAPKGAPVARDLPVASCPDLDRHLKAAADRDRLQRQIAETDRRIEERESSLNRQFELIERILARRGFIDGWALTERGEILARVFHESDLLVASVIAEGILDGLDAPSMAGVVSLLTYEHRSKDAPPAPWFPSKEVRKRATEIEVLARAVAREEERAGLPATRQPDPTFLALAYAWAAGESFATVVAEEDLSGGDFVRNIKQLIDLLRQVGEVSPDPQTASVARDAADRLFRGIISASSEVTGDDVA